MVVSYTCSLTHAVMGVLVWPYVQYHNLIQRTSDLISTHFPVLIQNAVTCWKFMKTLSKSSMYSCWDCNIHSQILPIVNLFLTLKGLEMTIQSKLYCIYSNKGRPCSILHIPSLQRHTLCTWVYIHCTCTQINV